MKALVVVTEFGATLIVMGTPLTQCQAVRCSALAVAVLAGLGADLTGAVLIAVAKISGLAAILLGDTPLAAMVKTRMVVAEPGAALIIVAAGV